MSGVRKYWEGGTNDAEGKPHIAETEFERRYGADIANWFECYRARNLSLYYDTLVTRAVGDSTAERVSHLLNHPHASAIVKCLRAYDEFQIRFHQAHLGLAVQQLKLIGVDVGTGGTSFRDYLAKYNKEQAPLFPGLTEVFA